MNYETEQHQVREGDNGVNTPVWKKPNVIIL